MSWWITNLQLGLLQALTVNRVEERRYDVLLGTVGSAAI
jgi:hypothetical protein